MMRTTTLALCLAAALAACTSASDGKDDPSAKPTLVVTSPTRGTTADAGMVTVTGTVTGSHVAVTVNGTTAAVAPDGSFTAQVAVTTGVTILETHATDNHNHDVRDVRAVLAGTLQTSDGSQSAPLAAHAGAPALRAIGNAMATDAEQIDFTAEVQKANPVYNNGGCLGAVVNVTSVDLSNIGISVTPSDGALVADVEIDNLVVKAHADYKAACIGGSTTITLTSSAAHIHGEMGVSLDGNALTTSLPSDTVTLDNFNFDVGGLPSAVENLVKNTVRDKVQNALADTIKNKAPGLANSALASLVAKPIGTKLLGKQTTFSIAPSYVDISTAGGLYVEMSSTIAVDGGEGGMYAATGATASPDLLAGTQGLGLAVANDSVNALLAGLWGAGALDQHLDASSLGAVSGLLDPSVKTLDLHFSLPPTVASGDSGQLALAIGDLILTGKDASGNAVQTIALSVATALTAGPTQSGKLALVIAPSPTVKAQVIQQLDGLASPLSDDGIEAIVGGAWGIVGSTLGTALGKMPMPTIAGVTLGAPTMTSTAGFALADIGLD